MDKTEKKVSRKEPAKGDKKTDSRASQSTVMNSSSKMINTTTNSTSEERQEEQRKVDQKLMEQISSFGSLISKYTYGEGIVQVNGGFHIEKSIQQSRPSLLQAL